MSIRLQFLILILSLISGVISILISNRIMRKFRLNYLSSYFYFLVFIYVFCVYSIIGSQSLKLILQNQSSSLQTINSITSVLIALGIPFLILALYMFIRISHEFYRIELPRTFILLYFLVFAVSFLGYGLMNIDIGGFETVNFFMDTRQLVWTFSGMILLVFGYSLVFTLLKSKQLKNVHQRNAYRWFSFWYAVIGILGVASLQLTEVHILFGLVFIVILTGFHLIPVLFLSLYLPKYYVDIQEIPGVGLSAEDNLRKYDISKREAEIIDLICKGHSNQEISDSLYISLQTVKDHIYRIFIKTGVKNRVQLVNLFSSAVPQTDRTND